MNIGKNLVDEVNLISDDKKNVNCNGQELFNSKVFIKDFIRILEVFLQSEEKIIKNIVIIEDGMVKNFRDQIYFDRVDYIEV